MYDERTNLSAAVAADLRDFYGLQVFQTVIPRNVKLAEAPSYGKPIINYDAHSKGADAYSQLAREIIHESKSARSRAGSSPVG
jgi:chromosome partitioning protein